MNSKFAVTGLAALMTVAAGGQVLAQGITEGPPAIVYQRGNDAAYQSGEAQYQAERDAYRIQQDRYEQAQARYRDQQARYQDRRAEYAARKAAYEARWGRGAWDRREVWYSAYEASPCEREASANTAAGGVIGALAGAAIGSNIAAHGVRSEGAVLGALAGGALGASIGRSTASCDSSGYYFTYNQTYPYREAGWKDGYHRTSDAWYVRERCRLAVAPADWNGSTDYRYVRVCPDRMGRYRITGG